MIPFKSKTKFQNPDVEKKEKTSKHGVCSTCRIFKKRVKRLQTVLSAVKNHVYSLERHVEDERDYSGFIANLHIALDEFDADETQSGSGISSPAESGGSGSRSSGTLTKDGRLDTEFEIIDMLGKGSYGQVLKVKHKLDKVTYAIKKVVCSLEELRGSINEVEILCKLAHSNVVRYFTSWSEANNDDVTDGGSQVASADDDSSSGGIVFEDKSGGGGPSIPRYKANDSKTASDTLETSQSGDNDIQIDNRLKCSTIYIQMEHCNTTLRESLKAGLVENPCRVTKYLGDMIDGLQYIHAQGLIHRDLKPANVFIDFEDRVKIGDFGLSTTQKWHNRSQTSLDQAGSGSSSQSGLTGSVGTTFYIALEAFSGPSRTTACYDHRADIFSLGVIIVEMLHPFSTDMERHQILTNLTQNDGWFPPGNVIEERLYENSASTLRSMLSHLPQKRPTLQEVKADLVTVRMFAQIFENPDKVSLKYNWPTTLNPSLLTDIDAKAKDHGVLERHYIRQYQNEDDVLICEKITLGPGREFCDFLQFCPETSLKPKKQTKSPPVILYFVKRFLGESSLNSTVEAVKKLASFLKSSLDSGENDGVLQRLYENLKGRSHSFLKNFPAYPDFLESLSGATFVCAVRNMKGVVTIEPKINLKTQFRYSDFHHNSVVIQKARNKEQFEMELKNWLRNELGFLGAGDHFTPPFYKFSLDTKSLWKDGGKIVHEGMRGTILNLDKKNVFTELKKQYFTKFTSSDFKRKLLTLQTELEGHGFGFKIYEIPLSRE